MRLRRAVIITLHYLKSKRRAGPHWIADALWRNGWEVVFVTAAISRLSRLRRDFRFEYPVREEAGRLIEVEDGLFSFVWYTPWHPANLRLSALNRLASPLFQRYDRLPLGDLSPAVDGADLVIFDSTPALLLFERFKELAPDARFVYRVSDDLRVLKNHQVVLDAERRYAPHFDLLSIPSPTMLGRFELIGRAELHYHGIRKHLFDAEHGDPYDARWRVNLVFVGKRRSRVGLDESFFEVASRAFPEWGFHVIGDLDRLPGGANVIHYGEMPFEETVPYLKHADVGLQPRLPVPGIETTADSLKMIQYTYCQLPIVAPRQLASLRSNVVGYESNNAASIRSALEDAATFDRESIDRSCIHTWDDLALKLSGDEPAVVMA